MWKQKGYRAFDGRSLELLEHCSKESGSKVNILADIKEA